MAQWDDLHPGRGITSAVNDAATRVGHRSTGTETVRSALSNAATGTTEEVWAGDAGAAFRTSLTKPQTLCSELTTEFAAVQSALTAYAAEVDRIRTATAAAHQAYATGYATWKAAEQEESLFPLSTYTFNAPTPTMQPGLWVPSGTTAGLADMRLAAQQLRNLATQRESADNALVAALAPPASPRWDAMQSALSYAGIDDIDDLTYDNLGDAFANIADEIAEGDITDENTKAMQDFFDAWGDDTFVMSQFFLETGGENTVSMINNLGYEALGADAAGAAALLALGTSIRGGLSTGSQIWTSSTSKDFAESMLTGASSTGGGAVAAIGFLFSDERNHPLGVNLTVAMADEIDAIERDPMSMQYGGWTDSSPNAGGRLLAFLEGEQTGLDGNRVDDLAGRIFSTLGTYPDAALDWLTSTDDDPFGDGDLGAGRVEYWYGERDWSANGAGDGFEGPSALWAGAQQAAGGPADAMHSYNPETWERVATLTTQVVNALTGNESFLPENLTSIGQVRLAEGISLSVPYFSEAMSDSNAGRTDPFGMNILIGMDEGPRAIPNVQLDVLAQLLGTATWSDGETPSAGAAVMAQSVGQYQDALVALAEQAPPGDLKSDLMERVIELQGWIDGSPAGAALAEATRHDAAVQAAIDGVATVVGLIPIPMAGDLLVEGGVSLLDDVQDFAMGQLTDAASGQAAATWGNNHEVLLQEQENNAEGRENAARQAFALTLEQVGLTEGLSPAQVEELVGELFRDYQRGVEANTSWAEGH